MCFRNQIVNVREIINDSNATLQALPLTPEYFGKFCVNYDFDPQAECPNWMEYLETTFDKPEIR